MSVGDRAYLLAVKRASLMICIAHIISGMPGSNSAEAALRASKPHGRLRLKFASSDSDLGAHAPGDELQQRTEQAPRPGERKRKFIHETSIALTTNYPSDIDG
ncbi:MAG: hypothetical protein QOF66_5549 [Mycobacterium sp.]|jgi:hypothetical protein|nr:hypothetical protein [Mycobacterium sp.]